VLSPELKHLLKQYYVQNVESIYVQKAICILSHYSFMKSFKEILKQLYRIHLSTNPMPIERYICNFMEEIPIPDIGHVYIEYELGGQKIPFFRPIDQYAPYAGVTPFPNF